MSQVCQHSGMGLFEDLPQNDLYGGTGQDPSDAEFPCAVATNSLMLAQTEVATVARSLKCGHSGLVSSSGLAPGSTTSDPCGRNRSSGLRTPGNLLDGVEDSPTAGK